MFDFFMVKKVFQKETKIKTLEGDQNESFRRKLNEIKILGRKPKCKLWKETKNFNRKLKQNFGRKPKNFFEENQKYWKETKHFGRKIKEFKNGL